MADEGRVDATGIPTSLAQVIAMNSEYAVLLCAKSQCRRAQTVKGIEEHLRSFHHEKPAIRKEAGEFGRRLARQDVRFLEDYTVVNLPANGLAPQPVVPVVDGFSFRLCRFLTVSRFMVRKHVNKKHSVRGKEDEHIVARVRLQRRPQVVGFPEEQGGQPAPV